MDNLARFLIIIGLVFVALGGLVYLMGRFDIPLGRLPGDVRIERGNMTCLIGIGTSLFLSVLLTVILNIVIRLLNK